MSEDDKKAEPTPAAMPEETKVAEEKPEPKEAKSVMPVCNGAGAAGAI